MEKFEVKTIDEIKCETIDESEFDEKIKEYVDKLNNEYILLHEFNRDITKSLKKCQLAMSIVKNICEFSEKDFVELDAIHDILDRYV